uniref:Thymocyte nuclear protein 1 n=1 Tax=Esox lucius TaxID=8010 RepID=A0A3P8YYQ5_ESOLU
MAPKKRIRGSTRTSQSCSKEETKTGSLSEDSVVESAQGVKGKRKAVTSGKTRKQSISKDELHERPQFCHWLMKSEPESRFENGIDVKFGIEDLKALPNQRGCWDGVRNYQARNFMRDMKEGQQAFFYHSNCKEPGIAGIVKIVKESYVDHTQFDKNDVHYDASSKADNPKWSMVDVQFERMLKRFIPLSEMKKIHLEHKARVGPLKDMALFTRPRLSVQPLTSGKWRSLPVMYTPLKVYISVNIHCSKKLREHVIITV